MQSWAVLSSLHRMRLAMAPAAEQRVYTGSHGSCASYATGQAKGHIPMTMEDWASKLDAFLQFNDAEILQDKGKGTVAIAKALAESEFEK